MPKEVIVGAIFVIACAGLSIFARVHFGRAQYEKEFDRVFNQMKVIEF